MATESEGARKIATSERYGTGLASGINSFLFSKFNRGESKGGKGSTDFKGRNRTAEDWHNEEIAKRYDAPREDYTKRRDWKLGEKTKNYDWMREETSADTKMNRDTFMAEEGSRRRRTDVGHALRTGAKFGAKRVTINDGGGFEVAGPGRYERPLRAAAVAQPSKPKTTTRQTAGTPPKPRTPRTPAAPAGVIKPTGGTTRTPAKPTGGTSKPRGPKLPAAGSGDVSITGFPNRA